MNHSPPRPPSFRYDWCKVRVVGELEANDREEIQLAGYARQVFGSQPGRRYSCRASLYAEGWSLDAFPYQCGHDTHQSMLSASGLEHWTDAADDCLLYNGFGRSGNFYIKIRWKHSMIAVTRHHQPGAQKGSVFVLVNHVGERKAREHDAKR